MTTTVSTQNSNEDTQQEYINKILGPPPGKEGRFAKKLMLYCVAYIVFAVILGPKMPAGLMLITFGLMYVALFFLFVFFITAITHGASYKQRQHHQDLKEKLLSGEIQPDFYYPSDGNSEYLILDHKNDKLWAGIKSADISDIKSIQITAPGRNQKGYHILFYFRDITLDPMRLHFAAEKGPKAQMVYERIKEELDFS
ncbi:hypothetical protein [Maridesulfovibrio sp.]|uniref:hypothetical protein n=1 Tax=Maridesulfovibrio sp. TaxID=2795000 RepID=UPI003B000441